MKQIKLITNDVTNVIILIVTLLSLFISFQITSNNYRDNIRYSQSYFLMDKHYLNNHSKNINEDMYYLIDSPKNTNCVDNGHIKYYLLDKTRYTINQNDSILYNNRYYLVSCKVTPKYNLGVIKKEKAYYMVKDRTFSEFFKTYKTAIGGYEPIYIFLSYVSSSVLDYDYFILLINLIFLLVLFLALKKFTQHYKYMYVFLVSFDFYIYIYLSNIHRLKLAFIFLLLSYLTHHKTKIIMLISALFSHLQIFIFYIYYFVFILIHDIKLDDNLSKKKAYSIYTLLVLILGLIFKDQIIEKVSYYLQMQIPYKVGALVLIYLIYLFIFKLRDTIKLFVPLAIIIIVISFFIGSSRVNFILMEFILVVELNRVLNKNIYALLIVVPFITYSLYKSIHYLQLGLQ